MSFCALIPDLLWPCIAIAIALAAGLLVVVAFLLSLLQRRREVKRMHRIRLQPRSQQLPIKTP